MGSIVEQAVLQSVDALRRRDPDAAGRIYASDVRVNEKRFRIEQDVLELIATQQPIARDLRVLASILEVITELERMGDYAKGIARNTIELSKLLPLEFPQELQIMADRAAGMLHDSLTAFYSADVEAARQIPVSDDEVDTLYNQVIRGLIEHVRAHPSDIDAANYLMWAAHNLERLADRVSNICERTVFMVTGEMVEFGE